MNFISKFIRKLFFSELDRFSKSLGYKTWDELMDNTYHIFTIPPDAEWFVSELPNKKWAVWNDEGEPPFPFTEFSKWEDAIRYLRNIFEKNGYPEENWDPEGFDFNDDIFSILPKKSKRIDN
jgi:hypothetical protein